MRNIRICNHLTMSEEELAFCKKAKVFPSMMYNDPEQEMWDKPHIHSIPATGWWYPYLVLDANTATIDHLLGLAAYLIMVDNEDSEVWALLEKHFNAMQITSRIDREELIAHLPDIVPCK